MSHAARQPVPGTTAGVLAHQPVWQVLHACALPWPKPALTVLCGLLSGMVSFPILFYFYSGWAWQVLGLSHDFAAMGQIAAACLWLVLLALALDALASYLALDTAAELLQVLCLRLHRTLWQLPAFGAPGMAAPTDPASQANPASPLHPANSPNPANSAHSAHSPPSADAATLSSAYAQNIEQFVLHLQAGCVRLSRTVSALLVFFLIILLRHPEIAVLPLLLGAATLILPPRVAARAEPHVQREAGLMAESMQAIAPFYRHFRTIGTFLAPRAGQQVGRLLVAHHVNQAAKWFYWNSSFNLKTWLNLLTLSLVLISGGWQVLQGSLTLAQLFSLFLAISLILPRFNDLYDAHFHFTSSSHHATILLPLLRQAKRRFPTPGETPAIAPALPTTLPTTIPPTVPPPPALPPSLPSALHLSLPGWHLGQQTILPALNLHFPAGRLLLLSGPSGCGKTTLARILAGLLPAPEALISLDGARPRPSHMLLGQVAYIGQQAQMLDTLSAVQYIACQAQPSPQRVQQILAAARALGLAGDAAALAKLQDPKISLAQHYSGGEKQRLHLLQGWFAPQKIRIFDEPTSALDQDSAARVQQMLAQVPHDEIRIVITHDANWPGQRLVWRQAGEVPVWQQA